MGRGGVIRELENGRSLLKSKSRWLENSRDVNWERARIRLGSLEFAGGLELQGIRSEASNGFNASRLLELCA